MFCKLTASKLVRDCLLRCFNKTLGKRQLQQSESCMQSRKLSPKLHLMHVSLAFRLPEVAAAFLRDSCFWRKLPCFNEGFENSLSSGESDTKWTNDKQCDRSFSNLVRRRTDEFNETSSISSSGIPSLVWSKSSMSNCRVWFAWITERTRLLGSPLRKLALDEQCDWLHHYSAYKKHEFNYSKPFSNNSSSFHTNFTWYTKCLQINEAVWFS